MDEALGQRLDALRLRHSEIDRSQVANIVHAVLASLQGELSPTEAALLREVEELGRTIQDARLEIAAVRPDDIVQSHIPSATDELDAIVAHTAAATDTILEVCETLDVISGKVDAATAEQLQEAVTRIYEACSFQDITGQRINKVVAVLKAIDAKVAQIVTAFGRSPSAPSTDPVKLENGPQLPANAMQQSDIDALLASFD